MTPVTLFVVYFRILYHVIPLIFLRLLVAHASFVLISFLAEYTFRRHPPSTATLESLLNQHSMNSKFFT
jgi:hypothetical protein